LADMCSDCHKFYNRAQYTKNNEATINHVDTANNPIPEIAANDYIVADNAKLKYKLVILKVSKHIKDAVKV